MSRIFHQQILVSPPPPPPLSNLQAASFDMDSKISPSILLIIVILAIIFFVSGLLHLLVRFLLRSPNREPEDFDDTTAFQGQLQQLFHLHDAGVDQSFIDTLPVFNYKQIIGIKNYPFDCAVCLCEFEDEDKLRLLPKCSHAFHMECIDTWLLSHSSCPLCRSLLLPDFSANNGSSPVLLVLESNESSREIVHDRDREIGSSHRGFAPNCDELGSNRFELPAKSSEIATVKDAANAVGTVAIGEKVLPVKLGKFRNVGEGSNSTNGDGNGDNADARRCFSMGSFAYVMDENSSLQVPIRATPITKPSKKKPSHLPLTPGHRLAMSECDCESRRDFSAFDLIKSGDLSQANAIGKSKRESFSVSKIWMRSKRDKGNTLEDSSRRAFSMRFPMEDLKERNGGGRTNSEMGIGRWQSDGNQTVVCDSNNIIDAQAETPSFARRTLLWLVGKQSKVVHSSSETNAP